jgi:putative addiction module component (TIGR02574 family)
VSDGELVLFLWPAGEGGYNVTSPLDPALITQAETVEEAFLMAHDVMDLLSFPNPERKMSQTLSSLGIDKLSPAQRILLVEEIWDSIASEAEQAPLTEPQQRDLERRLASYVTNPTSGSSWEEVKARLQGKP